MADNRPQKTRKAQNQSGPRISGINTEGRGVKRSVRSVIDRSFFAGLAGLAFKVPKAWRGSPERRERSTSRARRALYPVEA
jgi:hypothetical protein